jgi:ABC-type sugar transport system permease subunit
MKEKTEKIAKSSKFYRAIPYLMILPTFIFLGIFSFYPCFIAVSKSFFNWSGGFGTGINKFVGFKNYVYIFKDDRFWVAWKNVLFFLVMGVVINLTFPPLFAILVSRFTEHTSYVIRVINIIPMVVPSVVVYLLWKTIYNPQYGLFTQIAQIFRSSAIVDMLGTPKLAKWAFVLMGFPWTGGTVFLIYYAGINNISSDVLEAAVLDGANTWNMIVHIYYPLLVPQFKMLTAMQVISGIQGYVNIQTITGGGPGDATYVPGLYIYDMAFGGSNRYGMASAASVILTVVICILVLLNNYVFSRRQVNE